MKLAELKKFINEQAKNKLLPIGFKKDGYGYSLNSNGFTYKISISSIDRDNSFPTSFAFWAGFIGVDKIMLLAVGNNEELKKLKSGSQLFIRQVELFELGKYPVKDYDIYTFDEAEKAISEMFEFLNKTLLPSYIQYNNLAEIERKINSNEFINNTRQLSVSVRFGLILSKLSNPSNYDTLKNGYRKQLLNASDWDKQELEKVIEFLDNHSQEELLKISETA
jgi:hypothetical protein